MTKVNEVAVEAARKRKKGDINTQQMNIQMQTIGRSTRPCWTSWTRHDPCSWDPSACRYQALLPLSGISRNIFFTENFVCFVSRSAPTTGRIDNSNMQRGGALDQLHGHPNHLGGAAGYLPFYDRLRGGCHRWQLSTTTATQCKDSLHYRGEKNHSVNAQGE